MKHTIEELQFAATVRELVRQRRNGLTMNMTDEARAEVMKQPADDLIKDVLDELGRLATVIAQHRPPQQG